MASYQAKDLPYDLEDLLEQADGHPDLSDWQDEFITDMKARYKRYGLLMYVTESQAEQLDRVMRKVA